MQPFSFFSKICDKLGIVFRFSNTRGNTNQSIRKNNLKVNKSSVDNVQQIAGDQYNTELNQHFTFIDIFDFSNTGGPDGNFIQFRLRNIGNVAVIDVKYSISYNEVNYLGPFFVDPHVFPGEVTKECKFEYRDKFFFKNQVKNLKIIFTCKTIEGKVLEFERGLNQIARADGNFNISTDLGDLIKKEK